MVVFALFIVASFAFQLCAAHSNLIYPKPRNAIDSLLPEWSGGKAPYLWPSGPKPYEPPCACTNWTRSGGAQLCESAQVCGNEMNLASISANSKGGKGHLYKILHRTTMYYIIANLIIHVRMCDIRPASGFPLDVASAARNAMAGTRAQRIPVFRTAAAAE